MSKVEHFCEHSDFEKSRYLKRFQLIRNLGKLFQNTAESSGYTYILSVYYYQMISWDESKREAVIKRHGIDFAEIEDVFDDVFAVAIEDFEHSTDEETRFNIIGMAARYGLIFVAYIFENEPDIRLITARSAEKWMVKEYEENRKRL